jgi:hypothetical protein
MENAPDPIFRLTANAEMDRMCISILVLKKEGK